MGSHTMSKRLNKLLAAGSALGLAGVVAFAAPSQAAPIQRTSLQFNHSVERPHNIAVRGGARAPIGWIEFCVNYKPQCNVRPLTPRDIVLSQRAWSDLNKINLWVNQTIKPMTDLKHWGVIERWNYPDDGYGDCEDYVLLKRRMLMEAGWPRQALLITVVRDQKGDGHAVLTVETTRGEFVLDNEVNQILPWDRTGYRFVKRQSQSDPNKWVALGSPHLSPPTVSAR